MSPWILAARPKTLPAAVVPVWVGTVLGWKLTGRADLWFAASILVGSIFIQIATNFFNDAIDFKKGADTAERLGPVRATASGLIPPARVLTLGWICLGLSILVTWPVLMARGWPILAIGLPSLYFSFGYTGGPLPLAYRGLGELFVMIFFGLVAVTGTVFVTTGEWLWSATLSVGAALGSLSTVLIAINNLRDRAEDRSTGKRTLAVRFGENFARAEIFLLTLIAYGLPLIMPLWKNHGLWLLPGAILGFVIVRAIYRTPPSRVYNRWLAFAGLQLILYAVLFTLSAFMD